MEAIFQFVDEMIETRREAYCAIADDIWDHLRPALRSTGPPNAWRMRWRQKVSSSLAMRVGIPNAFIASVGEGQPVIALLGEFDALAGLSQQAHCAEPTPLTPGANGHGCEAQSARYGGIRRGGRRQSLAATAWRRGHAALLWLSRRGRRIGKNLYGARRVV